MTGLRLARRAFGEFLRLPTVLVLGALALASGMVAVDHAVSRYSGINEAMSNLVFTNPGATSDLLGTLVGSLITITGITFTVVLIALQQSAASLTHAVFDQFLRRRANQAFLGYFVGLDVYLLVVLATTSSDFNPVLSASLGLLLAFVALYLLVLIVYTTVDQMRPAKIIEAILRYACRARDGQADLVRRTRRAPLVGAPGGAVRAHDDGFVTKIDVDALAAVIHGHPDAEIVLRVSMGTYVARGDVVAEVRPALALTNGDDTVRRAVSLGRVRDAETDASFGVQQLVSIAWTSISTSKQSPTPGRLVIDTLRDLLGSWVAGESQPETLARSGADDQLPVVYEDDVVESLWDAFELMSVVCSESMQTQNLAEVVRSIATVFPRLDPAQQRRGAAAVMVVLAGLGDQVLTAALDAALQDIEAALRDASLGEADAVGEARAQLAASLGRLNSRSTRVPT